MSDTINRFIFDNTEVRGEHVRLEKSYQDILSIHHYPPGVANLLGEFLAAASLLSATIKFEGSLILQVRGDGEVPLIMAEANSERELRAIARDANQAMSLDFSTLIGNGQLAMTIDPKHGKRYQGIVSLDGDSLAHCLEAYFEQSEQLSTRIWLSADANCAAGLMLQELPSKSPDKDRWQHLTTIADTVQNQELLTLDADALLYRLYHQDAVRLFEAKPLVARCQCSRQRVENALLSIGQAELDDIIQERGQIETNCEFCNRLYQFSPADIAALFNQSSDITRH
ncbi:33 kDa chaperonin [Zhongshania aliphaticivorans]|uniref:33 kDa chaperonin n=1 Tax=Zhongshania aliphaticivorans TaxID=1470434 RepID=A0A5S9Q6L7_9GAMM|nr:Hsp33 family molecular chaperone HslO [Zhongshania aliphaticivorans]CAA0103456.1 33 kDa chaperonin [Zhongshania aliphaticivorans]CAA0113492.1 33 kDa chaperonin [Zhongshania aliphaticivorans]